MKKPEYNKIFWLQITMYGIAAVLLATLMPRPDRINFSYEVNRPWTNPTLYAPFDVPIYRDDETQRVLEDSVRRHTAPVFSKDNSGLDIIEVALKNNEELTESERKYASELVKKIYGRGVVTQKVSERIVSGDLPEIKIHEGEHNIVVKTAGMLPQKRAYVIFDSTVMAVRPDLAPKLRAMKLSENIQPNIVENAEETNRLLNDALQPITAATGVRQEGEKIIDRGDIVTPQVYTILKTYEQELAKRAAASVSERRHIAGGQFLFAALIFAALYFYLMLYRRTVFLSLRKQLCLLALMLMFFAIAVLVQGWVSSALYAVPFTVLAIVTVVFYDNSIALVVYLLEMLACSAFAAFPVEFLFIEMMAGFTAVFSIKEISKRSELMRASGLTFIAYVVAFCAVSVMQIGSFRGFSWSLLLFFCVNTIATSFAYALIFLVEKAFGFTSIVTLVELSDINTPLLRRLSEEAPGTFQHSMAVSNLASAAARDIEANVQLVRAGALYHDIGKAENPAYFTENQHNVNPHDSLSPLESARIIIGHVRDGMKLAQQANLPKVIRDIIVQHHGTSTARYFYTTYCNAHPGEEIDPAPFSYPGPNPRTKEASLIMMADVVEAASRSLQDHTEKNITELVNRMVDSQVKEGLHKDSPLSFRDITTIKKAFIRSLQTMYHTRVAYPTLKNKPAENPDNQ